MTILDDNPDEPFHMIFHMKTSGDKADESQGDNPTDNTILIYLLNVLLLLIDFYHFDLKCKLILIICICIQYSVHYRCIFVFIYCIRRSFSILKNPHQLIYSM
jgi:hypothetical protein